MRSPQAALSRPRAARSRSRRSAPTCGRRCRRRRTCAPRPGSSSLRSRGGVARTAAAEPCESVASRLPAALCPPLGRIDPSACRITASSISDGGHSDGIPCGSARTFGDLWASGSSDRNRLEGRSAVWTDDAQVLNAVVVRHPIGVIEDQRHPFTSPDLPLAAELTPSLLDALAEQPALEMPSRVGRTCDQDLGQGCGIRAHRFAANGIRIEVIGRNLPQSGVLLER
jgi:hypothetical protein